MPAPREEDCCPFCGVVVRRWDRGMCGAPQCMEDLAAEVDDARRLNEEQEAASS